QGAAVGDAVAVRVHAVVADVPTRGMDFGDHCPDAEVGGRIGVGTRHFLLGVVVVGHAIAMPDGVGAHGSHPEDGRVVEVADKQEVADGDIAGGVDLDVVVEGVGQCRGQQCAVGGYRYGGLHFDRVGAGDTVADAGAERERGIGGIRWIPAK